jgi:hypothetical protein
VWRGVALSCGCPAIPRGSFGLLFDCAQLDSRKPHTAFYIFSQLPILTADIVQSVTPNSLIPSYVRQVTFTALSRNKADST